MPDERPPAIEYGDPQVMQRTEELLAAARQLPEDVKRERYARFLETLLQRHARQAMGLYLLLFDQDRMQTWPTGPGAGLWDSEVDELLAPPAETE